MVAINGNLLSYALIRQCTLLYWRSQWRANGFWNSWDITLLLTQSNCSYDGLSDFPILITRLNFGPFSFDKAPFSSLPQPPPPTLSTMPSRSSSKQRQRNGSQAGNNQQMVRRDPSASQQQRGGGQLMKQNQQQSPAKTEKKPETTGAVRLDINLEVEVHIKARLHGDLTLALEM